MFQRMQGPATHSSHEGRDHARKDSPGSTWFARENRKMKKFTGHRESQQQTRGGPGKESGAGGGRNGGTENICRRTGRTCKKDQDIVKEKRNRREASPGLRFKKRHK